MQFYFFVGNGKRKVGGSGNHIENSSPNVSSHDYQTMLVRKHRECYRYILITTYGFNITKLILLLICSPQVINTA